MHMIINIIIRLVSLILFSSSEKVKKKKFYDYILNTIFIIKY